MPEDFDPSLYNPRGVNAPLARYREELGIEAPEEIGDFAQPFEDQLAVVLEGKVPVFSFTFGVPEEAQISALKEAETILVGTATTVREGLMLEDRGVDAVVGQGSEAGGHRGTFIGDFESALVGTMALVPQLADSLSVPVIAAGGSMDGRCLAAALLLGAEGVQMGTAFLPCPESGIHPKYKEAVLAAKSEETSLTRAFSGKPAPASATALWRRWTAKKFPCSPCRTPTPKISGQQRRRRTVSSSCPFGPGRRPTWGERCLRRRWSRARYGKPHGGWRLSVPSNLDGKRTSHDDRRVMTVISGRQLKRKRGWAPRPRLVYRNIPPTR